MAYKNLLEKAKESALLAVDVYNKPKTSFRTGGFVVLMCVAWTSLLHAFFEKNKIKYFYKNKNGRYEIIDGDKKSWDLLKSAKEFYRNAECPQYKNIFLFSQLRNKIEHRFMPAIDSSLSGECQALLLNFEEALVEEFSKKNSIIENLFIPLQLTKHTKSLPKSKNDIEIIDFIKKFRSSLSTEVANSQAFSFKAFFIPKLGNHRNTSDIAIEFIKFDEKNTDDMEKYQKMLVGIKEKVIPVANPGKYKPGDLYKKIKENFGSKNIYILQSPGEFISWNTRMWKEHKIRPLGNSDDPRECNFKYCQYDEPHKDYIYTDEWIKFLVKELKNLDENTNQT